jgi:hypothetical protein
MANLAEGYCPGSLTYPERSKNGERRLQSADAAVCGVCGAMVMLGYAGRIPAHQPPDLRS